MSKKIYKEQIKSPVQSYLLSEVFKTLNAHPNKTFNYKQLTTHIKPGFLNFIRETIGGDVHVEDLADELKKKSSLSFAHCLPKVIYWKWSAVNTSSNPSMHIRKE